MKAKFFKVLLNLLLGAMLGVAVMLLVPGAQADLAVSDPTPGPALVDVELTETRVLHYQGRLLNPSSGQPRPDGSYSMIFKLYDVETGGTALWTETKNVEVSRGLFSTLLGDTMPLNLGDFDGRDLWLGVTVGADPEATPRQRVAWVAYALHADTADSATDATYLEGYNSSAFYKGYSGVQYTETTPLAAGASETVFTFGYSPDQLVVWWVKPTTNGGKLHLEVDTEYIGADNTITYYLTVKNNGAAASTFELIRYTFYQ